MAEEEKNSYDTIKNIKKELKNKTTKYLNSKKPKKHVIDFEKKNVNNGNNGKNESSDSLKTIKINTKSENKKDKKNEINDNKKSTFLRNKKPENENNKNSSNKKTKHNMKNRSDIINYSNKIRKNNIKSVPKNYDKNYKLSLLFEYINIKDIMKNRNLDTFLISESEKTENTKKVDIPNKDNNASEKSNKQSKEKTGKRFSFILFSSDTYENKRKSFASNTDLKSKISETNKSKRSLINDDNSESKNISSNALKEISKNSNKLLNEISEIDSKDNQNKIKNKSNNSLKNTKKNSFSEKNDENKNQKEKNKNLSTSSNKPILKNNLLDPFENKDSKLPSLNKNKITHQKRNSAIIGKTKIKNLGFDIKDIKKIEEDENELLKSGYNALKSQIKSKEIVKIEKNNSIGYKSDGTKTENSSSLFVLINQNFSPYIDKKDNNENKENEKIYHIFGICSGSGDIGEIISNYLSNNIPKNINKELNNPINKITTIEKNTQNFEYTIKNIFYQLNNYLNSNQDIDTSLSGCCFCSLIITHKNIISINLGNNKSIIAIKKTNKEKNDEKTSNFIFKNLTNLHLLTNQEEKQRIVENNGNINYSIGYNDYEDKALRIKHPNLNIPGLKITRCFGYKDWNNIGVICEPEIHFIKNEERFKFIIIGSDSLWEVINYQEAVDIVAKYYDSKDVKNAVKDLVKIAKVNSLKKKDSIDDISVIVIFFNDDDDKK